MILSAGDVRAAETPTPADAGANNRLVEYVRRPDPVFGWTVRRQADYGGGRFAELILTSQRWREVTWRHQLFVYKPATVRHGDRAILLIAGGAWNDRLLTPPPADAAAKLPGEAALLTGLADRLETPVAVLLQVPAQPIFDGLYEDAAISYTFEQYFRTGDDSWPLLLPMVKSAVRAMDAVAEFAGREWRVAPKKFTVSGASKRGWTTWLTAAVDPRVDALAPMVIDMLDLKAHMRLQRDSWGGYSEQIHDYTERGIHKFIDTPAGDKLLDLIDPARFRARLTQPKLIILGTNDRYWPLESLNLYWDRLAGEKYVVYCPNNGHGLRDLARVVGGVAALQRRAAGELTLPKLDWQFHDGDDGVELVVRSDRKPEEVNVWTTTSTTRDFRESVWSAKPTRNGDGAYRYTLPKPKAGLAAMIGEAKFADEAMPYYFSTTVRVVEPSERR